MTDPRIKKLAHVLLHYSIKLKKGQLVKLAGPTLALPLLRELYAEALQLGAYPFVRMSDEGLEEIYYKHANEDQLKYIPPMAKLEVEKIDALVSIWAFANSKNLSGIDPKKQAMARKSNFVIMKRFHDRSGKGLLNWVGSLYPTHASAQDAGMSLSDYEDFVYGACKVDKADPIAEWKKASQYNQKLINYLKTKRVIRVTAPDTDLIYKTGGRPWINCDGASNFPDGEVFTSPVEDSVNGYIRYSFPAIYSGREVEDVRLEFKDGKVIKATAAKGQDFLEAMLNIDKGAKLLGEAAIGTNFGIDKFTRNILFDEKIGGTCHFALGESFPESGGKNRSALHWDMICDLRKGGCIYGDGQLFFKNGKFLK
jgi:aminopeptidase